MIPMLSGFSSPPTLTRRLPQPTHAAQQAAGYYNMLQFGQKSKSSEKPTESGQEKTNNGSKLGQFLKIAVLAGASLLPAKALAHDRAPSGNYGWGHHHHHRHHRHYDGWRDRSYPPYGAPGLRPYLQPRICIETPDRMVFIGRDLWGRAIYKHIPSTRQCW
jgi:hypothetical protein